VAKGFAVAGEQGRLRKGWPFFAHGFKRWDYFEELRKLLTFGTWPELESADDGNQVSRARLDRLFRSLPLRELLPSERRTVREALTLAVKALDVSPLLSDQGLRTLYRPFAKVIPLHTLYTTPERSVSDPREAQPPPTAPAAPPEASSFRELHKFIDLAVQLTSEQWDVIEAGYWRLRHGEQLPSSWLRKALGRPPVRKAPSEADLAVVERLEELIRTGEVFEAIRSQTAIRRLPWVPLVPSATAVLYRHQLSATEFSTGYRPFETVLPVDSWHERG